MQAPSSGSRAAGLTGGFHGKQDGSQERPGSTGKHGCHSDQGSKREY